MGKPLKNMARKYNQIYSKLVEEDTDVIGCIAYSLYKNDKVEFTINYKKAHEGKEPTEDDIAQFNLISSTDSSIEKYRFVASQLLQTLMDSTLLEAKSEIEAEVKNNYLELINKVVEPLKPTPLTWNYLHGIVQSILGAFLFMIILCGGIFVISLSKTQYSFTFGGNGNAKIEQLQSVDTLHLK